MKTLEKSLQLLELVSGHSGGIGVRELARMAGMNSTTVHGILSTFAEAGYLRSEGGKYLLGLKSYLLGKGDNYYQSLWNFCLPYLDVLKDRTGHTTALTVMDGNDIILLGVCEPESGLAVIQKPGRVTQAHTMASGKLFLAGLDDGKRNEYLKRYPLDKVTVKTITGKKDFADELKVIRKNGYASVRDEQQEGVSALAIGIVGRTGQVIAAVGIKVPTMVMNPKKQRMLLAELITIVEKIQGEMS